MYVIPIHRGFPIATFDYRSVNPPSNPTPTISTYFNLRHFPIHHQHESAIALDEHTNLRCLGWTCIPFRTRGLSHIHLTEYVSQL